MRRFLFCFNIIALGFSGCSNSQSGHVDKLPIDNPSDSGAFAGKMRYTDILENFDTVYNDTFKIYYYPEKYISYSFNELRHNYFEPIDSSNKEEEFTRAKIHGEFFANEKNIYVDTSNDKYLKSKTRLELNRDELSYYYHLKQEVTNKEELRIFQGKVIKRN